MAITLGQLLHQIRFRLQGFGAVEDAAAELAAALDAAATEITLDSADDFGRGVVEIDLELVRVRQVDAASRTLQLPAYGRGYKGTTPAVHALGAEVAFNPLFPKSVVAQEINGVLTELYPDLYAIKVHETVVPSDLSAVDVPVDAVGVVSVWLSSDTSSPAWQMLNHWDFRPDSSDDGQTLVLGYGARGQAVRVVYATRPATFNLNATAPLSLDFTTVTGLPERVADLVALGVAARLAPFLHLSSATQAGAEARADAQAKGPDAMAASARLLYSEFRARVQAEQMVLVKEHPIRVHKVGV